MVLASRTFLLTGSLIQNIDYMLKPWNTWVLRQVVQKKHLPISSVQNRRLSLFRVAQLIDQSHHHITLHHMSVRWRFYPKQLPISAFGVQHLAQGHFGIGLEIERQTIWLEDDCSTPLSHGHPQVDAHLCCPWARATCLVQHGLSRRLSLQSGLSLKRCLQKSLHKKKGTEARSSAPGGNKPVP